ncbi:putative monooxygenase [Mycobacterium xenopi 3993]|nr:putative monooxygenase [Mycobacterium xenopi 3993]
MYTSSRGDAHDRLPHRRRRRRILGHRRRDQTRPGGLGDYRVIEAGDGVGGTWYWNTYPGIAVDIPSFSYQFSFEQSAHWSRTYAPGHELRPMRNTASTSTGSGPRSASTPKFSPRSSTTTTTCGGCRPTPAATSPQGFW